MAGSVSQFLSRLGLNQNSAMLLTIIWTAADNDGTVPATPTSATINPQIEGWWITKVITHPGSGAAAPTDKYDITLVDMDGLDIAAGTLVDRSSTVPEQATMAVQIGTNGFTFTLVNNSVNSATGVVKLFLNR